MTQEETMFETIDSVFLETCQIKMANNNDAAHGWSHVKDVARASARMARYAGVPLQPLLLAAISHDTYSGIDRLNHHLRAAEWIREELPRTFHGEWTEEVALCCEQHRASYKGEYTGLIQEAFASADRGILTMTSIDSMVKRSYKFAVSRGADHARAIEKAADHMPEKYGNEGYAKWPELYKKVFAQELVVLKNAASAMTQAKVIEILGSN